MLDFLNDTNFWVLVSFVIFATFAWVKGKNAFVGKLDGRIAEIKKEIETAEDLRREAQSLLDQYKRKQQAAAQEAETIISNAQAHAEQIYNQAKKDIAMEMTRRENQLQDRLARMEETASAEIRAYAADLAIKATTEIIASQMDEKTSARLVDESLKTITGHLN